MDKSSRLLPNGSYLLPTEEEVDEGMAEFLAERRKKGDGVDPDVWSGEEPDEDESGWELGDNDITPPKPWN